MKKKIHKSNHSLKDSSHKGNNNNYCGFFIRKNRIQKTMESQLLNTERKKKLSMKHSIIAKTSFKNGDEI